MYLAYSNLCMGDWNPFYGGYYCSCGFQENFGYPQMWNYQPHSHPSIKPQLHVPFIEMLDPSIQKKEIIIGNPKQVPPILEYMSVEGAAAPVISLKIIGAGGTYSWTENPVTSGYHIKSDIPVVQPGSKIIIEIKEVVARIRWEELINF
jgi:hypothetical protein